MYKNEEKSHQTHRFLVNFYMCEKRRGENQREYQSLKKWRNASEIVNILSGQFVCLRA